MTKLPTYEELFTEDERNVAEGVFGPLLPEGMEEEARKKLLHKIHLAHGVLININSQLLLRDIVEFLQKMGLRAQVLPGEDFRQLFMKEGLVIGQQSGRAFKNAEMNQHFLQSMLNELKNG